MHPVASMKEKSRRKNEREREREGGGEMKEEGRVEKGREGKTSLPFPIVVVLVHY